MNKTVDIEADNSSNEPNTVEAMMEKYGLSEAEARFHLAIQNGEISGDVIGGSDERITIRDVVPETFPDTD